MKEYAVVLERGAQSWSAYVPDLPGCVAAADTREETEELIKGAIEFHIEGLILDGLPVPEPHSFATAVSVAVAA